jgi:hypothetical protein
MNFVGHHILTVDQFDRADIQRVFEVADSMIPYASRPLRLPRVSRFMTRPEC